MREEHQKISSCEVLSNVCAIRITEDLKYFELLPRYGSYKGFMIQSR